MNAPMTCGAPSSRASCARPPWPSRRRRWPSRPTPTMDRAGRPPACPPRQCRGGLEHQVAGEAFAPSQGTDPMAQIAHLRDPARVDSRRAQCDRPPLRVLHAGVAAAPRASVDAAVAAAARDVLVTLLPDQAALVEARVRPRAADGARRARQGRRHRHRAGRRPGDAEAPARRRRRHGHAAGLRARARTRRVPVHRAVRLRGAARLGQRAALRHRSARARARRAAGAEQQRSTRATWRT